MVAIRSKSMSGQLAVMNNQEDGFHKFAYTSLPRPLYYSSYKNDLEKPFYGNIMYDKRVIRGSTSDLKRLAKETLFVEDNDKRQKMQQRRNSIREQILAKLEMHKQRAAIPNVPKLEERKSKRKIINGRRANNRAEATSVDAHSNGDSLSQSDLHVFDEKLSTNELEMKSKNEEANQKNARMVQEEIMKANIASEENVEVPVQEDREDRNERKEEEEQEKVRDEELEQMNSSVGKEVMENANEEEELLATIIAEEEAAKWTSEGVEEAKVDSILQREKESANVAIIEETQKTNEQEALEEEENALEEEEEELSREEMMKILEHAGKEEEGNEEEYVGPQLSMIEEEEEETGVAGVEEAQFEYEVLYEEFISVVARSMAESAVSNAEKEVNYEMEIETLKEENELIKDTNEVLLNRLAATSTNDAVKEERANTIEVAIEGPKDLQQEEEALNVVREQLELEKAKFELRQLAWESINNELLPLTFDRLEESERRFNLKVTFEEKSVFEQHQETSNSNVDKQIEQDFVPWLTSRVSDETAHAVLARWLDDAIVLKDAYCRNNAKNFIRSTLKTLSDD